MQTEATKQVKTTMKTQIQEMLAIITAFSNLLARETAALKKADFKTVDTLQADKKLFAKQYHAKVVAMHERREEFPMVELALREKLIAERKRFDVVLADNMYALELAQNSTKRLVDHILEAARNAVVQEQQTHYSNGGKAATYKSASSSLSIDQSL